MSILIVSDSEGLVYLLPQGMQPSPVILHYAEIPSPEAACWKDATHILIEKINSVQLAAVTGGAQYQDLVVLQKPVAVSELFGLLRQILSQSPTISQAIIPIGSFQLFPLGKYLLDPHQRVMVNLTALEVNIIRFLEASGRNGASKEQLLKSIWGVQTNVDTHTVETHMYRLRQKVSQYLGENEFILTDGSVYRLNIF